MGLTFAGFRKANVERCRGHFKHELTDWSALEWAGAMNGEIGEAAERMLALTVAGGKAANVAKKLKRIDTGCAVMPGEGNRAALVAQLADELGDVVAYADLLAAAEGIDLAEAVARKFDRVSERVGYPRRIGGAG